MILEKGINTLNPMSKNIINLEHRKYRKYVVKENYCG